jgi:mRNA-degrading endonuclease toxin of MazEF toxin-antitoxin module
VVNVTDIVTLDKSDLGEPAAVLPGYLTDDVDRGLRRVLDL